jgi:hypothetical protein
MTTHATTTFLNIIMLLDKSGTERTGGRANAAAGKRTSDELPGKIG